MRNTSTAGRTASAMALLFLLSGSADAKQPVSMGAAAVAAHPLPRFDALIAALQTPAAKPAGPAKTSAVTLPPGEGLETVKKMCSMCHGTDTFARQRHTKEKWNGIIDNMVSKGMEASDDDLEKIADYLATNLGPDSPAPSTGQPAPAPKADPQSH